MMASGTMQGEERNTQGDTGREKWRLAFTSYAHPQTIYGIKWRNRIFQGCGVLFALPQIFSTCSPLPVIELSSFTRQLVELPSFMCRGGVRLITEAAST